MVFELPGLAALYVVQGILNSNPALAGLGEAKMFWKLLPTYNKNMSGEVPEDYSYHDVKSP